MHSSMHMSAHVLRAGIPLVTLILLGGCGKYERHAGPMTSESRDIGDFDSISLRGSAQLHVTVGQPASLTVEGSQEAVQRLETEVDGDTLRIRTSSKEWMLPGGSSKLVVKVTVPKLEELRLEGGNDVRLTGFEGGETRIDIEGAANVKARGRVDELTVQLEGAGHADLRQLVAAAATVTVDGVGSVYVNSTESLDATMNGVGAILYSGTPRHVNTSMRGVGTISKDRERKDGQGGDWNLERDLERDERKPIDPETLQPEYEKKPVKIEARDVI
jgi:hypothetical protein